jgi:hypothetical protein
MPRSSKSDALHEIVNLGRGHLGMGNAVYYAPSIPPAKESGARAAHALHLPEGEPILILYDATLFGSAAEGFVVTPERLCWKNLLEHPRQIEWADLDPTSVLEKRGEVGVAGGSISLMGELIPGAARFFAEMAARGGLPETSPYRSPAGEHPSSGEARSTRLVALARRHLGEVEHVYYHPAIPPHKLRAARAVHAARIGPDEVVAALYDDTVFGSAEEGFFLTPARVYWKNLTGDAESAAWIDLPVEGISASGNIVYIGERALQLTARTELAVPVASLLTAIVAEARGDRA